MGNGNLLRSDATGRGASMRASIQASVHSIAPGNGRCTAESPFRPSPGSPCHSTRMAARGVWNRICCPVAQDWDLALNYEQEVPPNSRVGVGGGARSPAVLTRSECGVALEAQPGHRKTGCLAAARGSE